tara:strand:+ start:3867 stop:4181 length:315 start_codon:yes stop_codon:yes gene_type:complete
MRILLILLFISFNSFGQTSGWYEILDQGLIAAFMGVVMVTLIFIFNYIKSLFNKAPESYNEPTTENKSIGNKTGFFSEIVRGIRKGIREFKDEIEKESNSKGAK